MKTYKITKQQIDDINESVEDYHKFNKYGKGVDINWCAILLGVLLLGVVYSMITANYNYGLINA